MTYSEKIVHKINKARVSGKDEQGLVKRLL